MMAEWTLHLKFIGDDNDYYSAVLEGARLKECVGAKGKHATQSCSVSIYDPVIAAKIFNSSDDVDAKIFCGDEVWFEGIVRPYATLQAERAYEKPVELEVIDYTELLRCYVYSDLSGLKLSDEARKKCVETAVWKNLTVSEIAVKLFELSRISNKVILDIPSIPIVKKYFCLESGKYLDDVIKELLYEYCYDFRFTPGKLTVFPTKVVSSDSTPVSAADSLSSFNLAFKVTKEDSSNDGVKLQYGDYHTSEFLLYSENTRFDGNFLAILEASRHSGLFYKGRMHDGGKLSVYGDNVPWQFTADSLKDKTVIDVLSVRMEAEIQDETGVSWSAHCDSFDKDGGKPYVEYDGIFDKWFGKGWGFVFRVYGQVLFQDKTLLTEKVLGLNPESMTADYIEESSDARILAANIQARNERSSYLYSFTSSVAVAPGSLVSLSENKVTGLSTEVRILSRTFNPLTGLYSYEAEGAGTVSVPEIFSDVQGGSAKTDVGQPYIMALTASKDSFIYEDPDEEFTVTASGLIFSLYGCTPSWTVNGNAVETSSLSIILKKSTLPVGSSTIECRTEYEGAVVSREIKISLIKASGEQGFGIVATVTREGKNETWWNAYASVGHEEIWSDTASIRNGCRIGDMFAVVGTSAEGNGHISIFRSTTDSGDLKGISISHTVSKKGVTRIFQYRLSKYGDIEGLGADLSDFAVDGNTTFFDGSMLFDDSTEWVDEASRPQPDATYQFLWERFSDDDGTTWSEPRLFQSYGEKFIEIILSRPTYDMSARGNTVSEQTVKASARIVGITAESLIWTITKGDATESITGQSVIDVVIPADYRFTAVGIEVRGGGLSASANIVANIIGDAKPVRLKTIDRSTDPPADFPGTLDDGSSLADGDYILCYVMDKGKRVLVPYRFDASSGNWNPVQGNESNFSEIVSSVAPEVLADSNTVASTSAIYAFFQNLFASNAFIETLEAMTLRIKGAIYGGGYDQYGNNSTGSGGVYINKDGLVNIVGLNAISANISGELKGKYISTLSPSSSAFTINVTAERKKQYSADTVNKALWQAIYDDGMRYNFTVAASTWPIMPMNGSFFGQSFEHAFAVTKNGASGNTAYGYYTAASGKSANALAVYKDQSDASADAKLYPGTYVDDTTANRILVYSYKNSSTVIFDTSTGAYSVYGLQKDFYNALKAIPTGGALDASGTVKKGNLQLSGNMAVIREGNNILFYSRSETKMIPFTIPATEGTYTDIIPYSEGDTYVNVKVSSVMEGIQTSNIYPMNEENTIGSPNQRFSKGYIASLYSTSLYGDVNASSSGAGAANSCKVWGAVAN